MSKSNAARWDTLFCLSELPLVRGGRPSGRAHCHGRPGHDGDHFARWTETTGDERAASFRDGDRYDLDARRVIR